MSFGKKISVCGLFLIIALTEFTSRVAIASESARLTDQRGNGGGGLVCRSSDGRITAVKALDIYEGEYRGMTFDFGPPESDPLKIVNLFIDRIAPINPIGAEQYRELARKFFDQDTSKFISGHTLPFSEDTGPIVPPVGCKYEQIVLQLVPQFPEDRLYTINRDLWDYLDPQNKAALVLHEILYRDYLRREPKNDSEYPQFESSSRWVRYRVQRIIAADWRTIDAFNYLKLFYYAFECDRGNNQFHVAVTGSLNFNGKIYKICDKDTYPGNIFSDFFIEIDDPLDLNSNDFYLNYSLYVKSTLPWKLGTFEPHIYRSKIHVGPELDIIAKQHLGCGKMVIGQNEFRAAGFTIEKTQIGYGLSFWNLTGCELGGYRYVLNGEVHEIPFGDYSTCHKATFDDKGNILTFDDPPCE